MVRLVHSCALPEEVRIFDVWVCDVCGLRWEGVENFPNDVTHWQHIDASPADPLPKMVDVDRLVAALESRADHYTREFESARDEGGDLSAASFGTSALVLREVARAVFEVSR